MQKLDLLLFVDLADTQNSYKKTHRQVKGEKYTIIRKKVFKRVWRNWLHNYVNFYKEPCISRIMIYYLYRFVIPCISYINFHPNSGCLITLWFITICIHDNMKWRRGHNPGAVVSWINKLLNIWNPTHQINTELLAT